MFVLALQLKYFHNDKMMKYLDTLYYTHIYIIIYITHTDFKHRNLQIYLLF